MNFSRWIFVLAIIWVLSGGIVLSSWYINYQAMQSSALEMVNIKGHSLFQLVQASRLWNSRHGGVYAPVTEQTPPNPYLNVPDRDIVDSSGRKLTMVNPAYMTRQITDLLRETEGIDAHLTSLKPLNPINKADLWEQTGLKRFEEGQLDGIVAKEGDSYRYLAPLLVKASCLKCHASQGYAIGDVRGGLSIRFPVEDVEQLVAKLVNLTKRDHLLAFFTLSILGVVMFMAYNAFQQFIRKIQARRAELEQEVLIDGLTQAFNHTAILYEAEREFKRCLRLNTPLTVLMLDIDYFKRINDTYGHQKGDEVLRQIALTIKSLLRDIDLIGRNGGEEFLVVLPDSTLGDAYSVAERIREAVAAIPFQLDPREIESRQQVTISIGLAERINSSSPDVRSLIKDADQALYQAKKQGRNRVENYLVASW